MSESNQDKELAMCIGQAARRARKELKLTQEDAAERINVSVEFYARIERGTSLPSILTFVRIVTVLGVSADELIGRGAAMQLSLPDPTRQPAPPPAPQDSPEIRRIVRRLRRARPSAIRLVNLVLRELERPPVNHEQVLVDDTDEPVETISSDGDE